MTVCVRGPISAKQYPCYRMYVDSHDFALAPFTCDINHLTPIYSSHLV
jgi:hypothetical protein